MSKRGGELGKVVRNPRQVSEIKISYAETPRVVRQTDAGNCGVVGSICLRRSKAKLSASCHGLTAMRTQWRQSLVGPEVRQLGSCGKAIMDD